MNMAADPKRLVTADDLNLDKLVKILAMTTSDNDGVVLNAVRAANAALDRVGLDWPTLLSGRVTVIGDPFGPQVSAPTQARYANPQAAAAPQTPPKAQPYKPPPPPNRYARDADTVRDHLDTLDFVQLSPSDNGRIAAIRKIWIQIAALSNDEYDFLCRLANQHSTKLRKRRRP